MILDGRTRRNWSLDGTLGGLVAFAVIGCCIHAIRPTASYRALELGGTATTVGLVAAAFSVVAVFLAIPFGRAVDRSDTRAFFLIGTLVVVLGTLVSSWSPSVVALVAGQLLAGGGWVAASLSFQTITANRRHSDRDRGFARLTVAISVGQFVGPLLAGFLIGLDSGPLGAVSGTTVALLAAATFGVTGLLIGLRTIARDPVVRAPVDHEPEQRAPLRNIARRDGVTRAIVVGVSVVSAVDLSIVFLPLIGEARGISTAVVGTLLSVRAIAGLLSRLVLPWMLGRFSRRQLLLGALTVPGVCVLGVATVQTPWVLAPLLAVYGFGLGVGTPLTQSWLATQTPRKERGTALALRMTGTRLSQTILPLGFGVLASLLGPGAVFVVLSGTLLSSSLLLRAPAASAEP